MDEQQILQNTQDERRVEKLKFPIYGEGKQSPPKTDEQMQKWMNYKTRA